ncbi:ribosomal protein S18-alanine N-acetyltransferase [Moellerella wisconsensis]|uniref:Ribosomal protein S18-alanine N-acetyltransferase n=2 Tax=Moellerella wisconsensis TaxID=158849 RepID=A0ACD3Y5S9_9GAMM|nr:ribosomal protein S18-alanine N-acetyltransferase [Moellerella wisconsensis]KLN97806.1 alanine acetyltransferase [Moellerella wisconsensis]UNH23776.1 ribosomal protein S18-alanine N-acetyltransferase [Moellerella wisconsensis]UNH26864.1 ribosomal protein S18-alanine N-acetyltransferase [Moellerella wisconsensis]UNH30348.1 ribosomal protein S18-alanine N-acetyltransferase [Moellerella wisconsensis]UNH38507.1 ribosomal protein S18-alanine N-acetyltransferase [Moellerella wisconsensis]
MTKISTLKQSDLATAFLIEKLSHDFPWSERVFYGNQGEKYYNLKISVDNQIIGFAITQSVLDEATLFNIAIHPDFQGQGYGRQLMERLIQDLTEKNILTLWLEVRESNRAAIRLYENMGFHEVTVRKDYYPAKHGREDALILALTLFQDTFTLE